MSDLIDRQAAIDLWEKYHPTIAVDAMQYDAELRQLPPASCSEFPNNSDLISRQAAIDAANKLVDRFEQILRDIRETNEDESVCGLCEYDGAFIGQSGDWCNECPGFEKDDCFRLSDECRKRWLNKGIVFTGRNGDLINPFPLVGTET